MDQNLNSEEIFIIRKVVYVLAHNAIISYPLHKKIERKNCVYNVKLFMYIIFYFNIFIKGIPDDFIS